VSLVADLLDQVWTFRELPDHKIAKQLGLTVGQVRVLRKIVQREQRES
jgi:hypothetical protein